MEQLPAGVPGRRRPRTDGVPRINAPRIRLRHGGEAQQPCASDTEAGASLSSEASPAPAVAVAGEADACTD
jgi:hypothetical protein